MQKQGASCNRSVARCPPNATLLDLRPPPSRGLCELYDINSHDDAIVMVLGLLHYHS